MTADDDLTAKSWYLVYTKARQEEVALTNIIRQGYGAYLPRARLARKRQGRRTLVVEPLFPRYLFIQLNTHTDNWGPIRSTLGVVAMVQFGREPARVPNELVDFLRAREDVAGLHVWAEPVYGTGDPVRVSEGFFSGYTGILLAHNSRERVVVLLDILGGKVRTQLAVNQLEHV